MFFIPCIKWNKHYYVRTSCCNTLYELDPEMGKAHCPGRAGTDSPGAFAENFKSDLWV